MSHSENKYEINLLDYWRVIFKYRRMIAAIVTVVSVVAVIVSLLLPKIYRAGALVVPVGSQQGGLSSLAGQFGGLASMMGINMPSDKGGVTQFVIMLKSRTLTENVIKRENLMPVLFADAWDAQKQVWEGLSLEAQPDMEEAVKALKNHIEIIAEKKDKTITITADFKDPQIAARVVNSYLEELQVFISENAFTTAKRNRIFIEGQLVQNKRDLLEAGREINEFYKKNRVSSSEADLDVDIGLNDRIEDSLEDKTKLAALNPGDNAAMRNLIAEKARVEKEITDATVLKDVPQQVYLTYLMLRQKLLAKVNGLLTTQYEMAKIEESKEDLAFQVIDYAVPPIKRYSPRRGRICIASFMGALFAAIILAFFREYLARMKEQTKAHG